MSTIDDVLDEAELPDHLPWQGGDVDAQDDDDVTTTTAEETRR